MKLKRIPELENYNWLNRKYIKEKLSSREIAVLTKTSQCLVIKYLRKHKIKSRNLSQSQKVIKFKHPFRCKIKELNNKQWLINEYVTNCKSAGSIAKEIGCSTNQVTSYLKRHKIHVRSRLEREILYVKSIHGNEFQFLNDRKWLTKKYIKKEMSAQDISLEIGCSSACVKNAIKRLLINWRGYSRPKNKKDDTFLLTPKRLEVINGCLLGDGWLSKVNKFSDFSYPSFCKKNIHLDHIKFVAEKLFDDPKKATIEKIIEYSECNGYKWTNEAYNLRTFAYKDLLVLFKEWYPEHNNYKKVVPRNLKLTPTVILHWFLDDGSSYKSKRFKKNGELVNDKAIITLCTDCFCLNDQKRLCNQFLKFGIIAKPTPIRNKRWRIIITQSQSQKFFSLIGPCPVPSMAYKWKLS